MSAPVTLHVKASSASSFTVTLPLSSTVAQAKEVIARERGLAAANVRLIYSGKVLDNALTLESYGALHGCA